MKTLNGNSFKNMLTGIFIALFCFCIGVYVDRWYIFTKIEDDIELNCLDKYKTLKNDEYTAKKIYTYKYLNDLLYGRKTND